MGCRRACSKVILWVQPCLPSFCCFEKWVRPCLGVEYCHLADCNDLGTHLFQKASDSLGEHSTADWIVAIWEGGDLVSPVIDFLEMVSGAMRVGWDMAGYEWCVTTCACSGGDVRVWCWFYSAWRYFHVLSSAAPALGWLACCKHPLRRRPLRQEPHRRWPTGRCPSGRGHSGRSTPPVGEKKWGFRSLE